MEKINISFVGESGCGGDDGCEGGGCDEVMVGVMVVMVVGV